MALGTIGTLATNSLQTPGPSQPVSDANVALVANAIKDDLNPAHPIFPGAFSRMGILFIPNRGMLRVLPTDYVAIDSTGWPILLSAAAVAAKWTYTP